MQTRETRLFAEFKLQLQNGMLYYPYGGNFNLQGKETWL